MKKTLILVSIGLLVITVTFAATIWKIANEGVKITFSLPVQGTTGSIAGLKADIQFDENNIESSKIVATVDVAKMETDNAQKTSHLLSSDFFNAEKYPTITFTSTGFKRTDSTIVAIGTLAIKDSIKQVELPFTFTTLTPGPSMFKGTMSIFSGDFGIGKKSTTGKDKVVIDIEVPVTR